MVTAVPSDPEARMAHVMHLTTIGFVFLFLGAIVAGVF
jgi:hypothetical protein